MLKNNKIFIYNLIAIFLLSIFMFLFLFSFTDSFWGLSGFLICLFVIFVLVYLFNPIILFFQIKQNPKTILLKILIFLNSLIIIISYIFLFFYFQLFPNYFVGNKEIEKQIKKEYIYLHEEISPILTYLENYYAHNKFYPLSIEKKILNTKKFDKTEYLPNQNGKEYIIKIYPYKGPIEYYQFVPTNNSNMKNFCEDIGLDYKCYYIINNNWSAVYYKLYTRHY